MRCIIREQVRRGHQVCVLTTTVQSAAPWQPSESYLRQMQTDSAFAGAEIHLGAAYGRGRLWTNYAFSPDCSRWLRRRLSDPSQRPDVIHIHGVFSHLTSAAAAWARRRSIPYLVRPAGSLNAKCFHMGNHQLKRAFTKLFLRKDLQRAAFVHATSPSEAEELRRWLPTEQIRIIPHGVDAPSCDLPAASDSFLSRYPQLRKRRVILFMSRLVAKKRPELIVEALHHLRFKYQDLALLVAGNDAGHVAALRRAVRRHRLEESVVFAGFLQGELKHGAFAVADVFALPSIDENYGMAVVEAMAHGVPVLVTRGVATHVYVDQSESGITVEGTSQAIAEGLRRLLDGDLEAMGRLGQEFLRQNLSWPAITDRLDELYREMLS